ncbi:MAG: tRNA lysidine(34) synthetase TilS [Chloroflexi bacterium]|nr:MAG: tRNA lysidine(34) synthetase TilS [Chloroflexota bacterium]
MDRLHDQVAAFCERHALLTPGSTVVVAVSGGPDSLCLLHVLLQLAPHWRLRFHVAHLDHQLRPESAADARFVADTAAGWDLPITLAQADIAAISRRERTGIEATARTVRLRFLLETAHGIGATTIALGHTADDQAETVLLRLLRGAGPSGLAAMRPSRPADATQLAEPATLLIRPLLATSRSEVEAYCAAHGLAPRHDASNESPIHLRNSVRGYILPLLKSYNPRIVTTLGRTARVCAEEDDFLNQLVAAAWPTLAREDHAGVTLSRAQFERLHPALQRRVLRQAVACVGGAVELEAKHVDLALAAIKAGRKRLQLPRGLWLLISGTDVRLTMRGQAD